MNADKQVKLVTRLLNISDAFVAKTQMAKEALELRTLLVAQETDYAPFLISICNKTGKPIASLPIQELQAVLAVHDNTPRALLALKAAAVSNCAPAWLITDDNALRALFDADPCGYWVYAANLLAAKSQDRVHDGIEADWQMVQAKHATWKNLQHLRVEEVIRCNELFRRILALTKKLNRNLKFTLAELPGFTASNDAFAEFCDTLRAGVMSLVKQHITNKQHIRQMSIADIANIQMELGTGYMQFARSGKGRQTETMDDLAILADVTDIFDGVTFTQLDSDTLGHKIKHRSLPKVNAIKRQLPQIQSVPLRISANGAKLEPKPLFGNTVKETTPAPKLSFNFKRS